jgi:hypothetical protein
MIKYVRIKSEMSRKENLVFMNNRICSVQSLRELEIHGLLIISYSIF